MRRYRYGTPTLAAWAFNKGKGVPRVAGAELGAAKGMCANAGGVAASPAITDHERPGGGRRHWTQDRLSPGETKDTSALAPSVARHASGDQGKQDAAVEDHIILPKSSGPGAVQRSPRVAANVTPPRSAAAVEAPNLVFPTRSSPSGPSKNLATASTTKPAREEVACGGAYGVPAMLAASSPPRTPTAVRRDGSTATAEKGGTKVSSRGRVGKAAAPCSLLM